MSFGPMHTTLLDQRSQVDLNSRVDQLTQKVDDQNNLIGQLLRHINLDQGPNLGPRDEEMRGHEHAGEQFERSQADETQTAASRTLSRSRLGPRTNALERLGPHSNVHARLGPQGARDRERSRDKHNDRRPPACSRTNTRHPRRRPERPSLRAEDGNRRPPARSRTNTRRQAAEESSQAQSPNLPHGQGTQGDRPLGTEEEVSQSSSRHCRRRPETLTLQADDVDKLVNDQLQGLRLKGSTEEALCKELDRVDCSPFTDEVERAPPPKRFTTPFVTPFKGDSDPESHLRHFKSVMILYNADDTLMCKVFAMTLRGAAQDWFHTLPSASIGNFKEFALIFTKEYLLQNGQKACRPSVQPMQKAKRVSTRLPNTGLPTEHELYRELAITPSQTLTEVFATAERNPLWDDDRITAKKASKQIDHPTKQASQKSNKFEQKARDKRRWRPQERGSETGTFTEFVIPIHQILAQVKDKPWVRRRPPMRGDPSNVFGCLKLPLYSGTSFVQPTVLS
ncbi:unnamed protein product [Prunus armeniaca]